MDFEDAGPFGELLKAYRKQAHMSQQKLAECLEVNRQSIVKWERGDNLPKDRGRIREIVRSLKLDPHQHEVLLRAAYLDASSTTPLWNIPHPRNPYFTGRDDLLDQLERQLSPEIPKPGVNTQRRAIMYPLAIRGLGGIGKTQIAVEYAYRSREKDLYTHTLWINAATEETIISSFVELSEILPAFSAKGETDQRKLGEAIKRWLAQCEERWLLIFDNADEIALVRKYIPLEGKGNILLTTRDYAVGSLATPVEVETMGWLEGVHLLLRRAQRFENASDEAINQAGNIVVALDHFPLALDQAGAYIEETQCGFNDYLSAYQNHRKSLLARRGAQATNYPDSVATTWSLSFQKVEQANPAATELLRLCAFLAPDRIPEELLRNGASYWTPLLQQAVADSFTFDQMLEELLKFSLVQRLSGDYLLSIHRLVQAVQRDRMASDEQYQWAKRVVLAIHAAFPDNPRDIATWAQCLRYLEQAQMCDTLIQHYLFEFIEVAHLLYRVGVYLYEHAAYMVAEPLYQRALHIFEQQLGPVHLDVAASLDGLATLLRDQGNYTEARPLYERAIHIREMQLGPDHPLVAYSLNDLATLLLTQGNYTETRLLYERALHIREEQLGTDHPLVASSLNGLAILLRDQGNYTEARPLYERALHIREVQLGPDHPHVAYSLNSLADLLRDQGNYTEARPLYERAIRIQEAQLGSEHSLVAHPLNGLANLLRDQGNYTEARPLYERALRIWEAQLGPDHPLVAHPLNGLANLLRDQQNYEKAETLYQQVLSIREHHLGTEHPHTARVLHDMGIFEEDRGNPEGALPLYQRALSIYEKALGADNPKTREAQQRWMALLQMLERDETASFLEHPHSEQREQTA